MDQLSQSVRKEGRREGGKEGRMEGGREKAMKSAKVFPTCGAAAQRLPARLGADSIGI